MKISVRNLEPTKVKLTITVELEEFKPYLDKARKEIAKQINVPGFRKGHVPGKIVDQRVGFAAVAGEAVNSAVPELYSQALEEKKISPMDQPEFEVQEVPESATGEEKLKFVATVERRPEFKLNKFDGVDIEVEKPEVTDEDVNARLEALRHRFATLVGVDRPIKKGDFANIDYTSSFGDEVVASSEGESIEVGTHRILNEMDEALEGLSAGEEAIFETDQYKSSKHEGEKAQVKVKVNSVKTQELPELDDDFAKEASEFDTLDELKEDVRKACEQSNEGRQATIARDAFIAKIQEEVEIPVPKGVKEKAVAEHLKGMTPDPEKATKDQKEEAEKAAEKELRDQMVLDALAEKLDVSVSQADVTNFLISVAQQYGMDSSQFISAIVRNGQLGSAVQEVARSKALIAGMRAVKFVSNGETIDLSAFLTEDDGTSEEESVKAASAAAEVADELSK